METNSVEPRKGVGRGVVAAVVFAITSLTLGTAAFAAPPDPGGTGAAMGDVETGITSWVENFGVPSIVTLLLVAVGLALLLKFYRKAKGTI